VPLPRRTHRTTSALAALGVLASAVTAAVVSAAPAANAAPGGDPAGVLAFAQGQSLSGGGTVTTIAPDGTSHTWQPTGTKDDPNYGGDNGISAMAYSPDGSKLAYIVDHALVWVANADGTDDRLLETRPGHADGLAWAPDGSALYFVRAEETTHSVYSIQANGTRLRKLFTAPSQITWGMSVSPDGDVATDLGDAAGNPSISIWHHDTGQLTPTGIHGDSPAFSPDGKQLAYFVRGPGPEALTVSDLDGGHARTLPADAIAPAVWAPDGSGIAYERWDGGIGEVFPATMTTRSVTDAKNISALAWQPHAYPAHPAVPPTVDRIGGADRIETAVAAGRFAFADAGAAGRQAAVAVLSRDDTFADALSGSSLAAAKNGPLLLTSGTALDDRVRTELRRVLPRGATVYLLGGTSALSPAVEQAVRDAGFTPKRLWGPDRDETSLAIAREVAPHPSTVLVATGRDYPDALAAGAYAGAHDNAVVVLSDDKTLSSDTLAYLKAAVADPARPAVATVGGQADNAVQAGLGQGVTWSLVTGQRFLQFAGRDRYETAARVAGGSTQRSVALATGGGWPDALAGGTVAGLNGAPLLLTEGAAVPLAEHGVFQRGDGPVGRALAVEEILVFGGPAVVPEAAVDDAVAASERTGWVRESNRRNVVLR
jgi:hypothetical protein